MSGGAIRSDLIGLSAQNDFAQFLTIANNTGAPANLGISCDSTVNRGVVVEYDILRSTNLSELRAIGTLIFLYRALTTTWDMQDDSVVGDDPGVTFSITAGGVVKYTSTNLAGTGYVGNMNINVRSYHV